MLVHQVRTICIKKVHEILLFRPVPPAFRDKPKTEIQLWIPNNSGYTSEFLSVMITRNNYGKTAC